jgi:transposase-like protein
MSKLRTPESLSEAIVYFADPDVSLQFLQFLRWPKGVVCYHCKAPKPMFLKTRRIWKCRSCRKQFSVKMGTIFGESPLGLDKWLPAIWMLANAKNGISSYELARALKVTQKTAWFMLSRIRLAMQSESFEKLGGEVEIDEAFIGGLAGNMHKKKRNKGVRRHGQWDKAAVLGMLERKRGEKHSNVVLHHVPNARRRVIFPHIEEHVEKGSQVYTDANRSYYTLPEREYQHSAVDHAIRYVDGKVHTNGLENFWSLLKRSIKGTYVSVDPFHLFRYLDEQSFRFNTRKEKDAFRFDLVVMAIVNKRLTYKELISADMAPATT